MCKFFEGLYFLFSVFNETCSTENDDAAKICSKLIGDDVGSLNDAERQARVAPECVYLMHLSGRVKVDATAVVDIIYLLLSDKNF